jgi:hypothetical protein
MMNSTFLVRTGQYKIVFSAAQNPQPAFPLEAAAAGRGNSDRKKSGLNVAGHCRVYKKRKKSQGRDG